MSPTQLREVCECWQCKEDPDSACSLDSTECDCAGCQEARAEADDVRFEIDIARGVA